MSAKFLTVGLKLWNESAGLSDEEVLDKIREFVVKTYKGDSLRRKNASKLKAYIVDINYTDQSPLPPRIARLGMSTKAPAKSDFITNGFSIYEKYMDSESLVDELVKYVARYYPNPGTRNSSFVRLKKAIADKYDDPTVLEFKLPLDMYDEVFKLNRVALSKKGSNCVVINNTDSVFANVIAGIKSDKIEELFPALILATGRRLTEITKHGSFEETDDPYTAIFTGQLKTDVTTPYEIPTMVPVNVVNKGLMNLRAILTDEPRLGTSYNSGRYVSDAFGLDLTSHDCRAIYATAMYQQRPPAFAKYNEAQYISKILGHQDTTSVPHYTCFKLNGLTTVRYMQPPSRPKQRPSKESVAKIAKQVRMPPKPKPAALVYPPIVHNSSSIAERRFVDNVNQLRLEGRRISQNNLRLLRSSPAVIKRMFAKNPGLRE